MPEVVCVIFWVVFKSRRQRGKGRLARARRCFWAAGGWEVLNWSWAEASFRRSTSCWGSLSVSAAPIAVEYGQCRIKGRKAIGQIDLDSTRLGEAVIGENQGALWSA